MEQQLTQLEPLEGEELDFRVAADSTKMRLNCGRAYPAT
jgi:hypothetical protein